MALVKCSLTTKTIPLVHENSFCCSALTTNKLGFDGHQETQEALTADVEFQA